jgi:hypothetical protein
MEKADEVAIQEYFFLVELLSTILQLSYACLCNEALWKVFPCEGCEFNWPSQKDHRCMPLTDEEEQEIWFYYYDEAMQCVDSDRVWSLAQEVSHMLEFNIHPSWKTYINELHKQSRTSVYLNYFICRALAGAEQERYLDLILNVLNRGHLQMDCRRKPLTNVSTLVYPMELLKSLEENMNTDC